MSRGTFGDTGAVTAADAVTLAGTGVLLTAVVLAATTALLDRRDIR